METMKFTFNYLNDDAIVTFCNTAGSIIYTGRLGDMMVRLIRDTKVVNIEGLGNENDLIITIEKENQ